MPLPCDVFLLFPCWKSQWKCLVSFCSAKRPSGLTHMDMGFCILSNVRIDSQGTDLTSPLHLGSSKHQPLMAGHEPSDKYLDRGPQVTRRDESRVIPRTYVCTHTIYTQTHTHTHAHARTHSRGPRDTILYKTLHAEDTSLRTGIT